MNRRKKLARKTSLKAKTPNRRKTRIKPKKTREWVRAYGSRARVAWVKRQQCVVCGGSPCENAHTQNGGAGRKGDAATIVPLCQTCHRLQHQKGWKLLLAMADEQRIAYWLDTQSRATELRWRRHADR